MKPVSVAVVGSCVSRDPFAFLPTPAFQVTSYLARQSFAGLARPPLAYEAAWYDGVENFERKCVFADLEKNDDYWRFETNADLLILDYIDERFDLVAVGETLVGATKHVRQPGFVNAYPHHTVMRRDSDAVLDLWKAGAAVFFERAKRALPARRIVLHEAYWAPAFRDATGAVTPFAPPWERARAKNNALLAKLYEHTKREIPGLSVVRPGPEALFADPEHKWSKEPFHYIKDYYAEFLDQLGNVVANLRGDGILRT